MYRRRWYVATNKRRSPGKRAPFQLTIATASVAMFWSSPVAAQSPSASVSLWQASSSPASVTQAQPSVLRKSLETQSEAEAMWYCEGFAASSEPWLTADVHLRLKLDSTVLADAFYSANYWGATYTLSRVVAATTYPRTLYCEILVQDLNGSVSGSQSAQITPRSPQDLRSVPPDSFTYTSPGNYLKARIWQVWDNYGLEWTYSGFPVTESYSTSQNGCNITFATGSTTTNNQGRFEDKYGNYDGSHTIPACALPQYQQCQTLTTQTIVVAGVSFSHDVTWGCFDVQISRQ